MPPHRRSGRPQRPTRGPRKKTVLIFTEGKGTEVDYLTDWRRALREHLAITIDPNHGVPATLVELAIERKRRDRRDARKGRGDPYDFIWCVFDRDVHPHVDESVARAHDAGIGVALSTPCIELWFMLHFLDQTAHIDGHAAQQRAKELLGCGKRLTDNALGLLRDRHDKAVERAALLVKMHRGNGSDPASNPSTGLGTMIEELRQLVP